MTCQASATRTATTSDTLFDTTRYAILSESFLRNRKLIGGRASLVLWALLTFRNAGTGLAWPSIRTIAELLGIDDRGVQRGLARLLELGIIEWTGRTTLHGVRIYLVHLAMPGTPAPGIINSRVEPAYMPTGGVVSRATGGVVSRVTQNIEDEQTKKQQPPTPIQLAGKPEGVVVVFPQAETAKATAINTEAVKPPPTVKESLPVALPDKHSSQSTTEHSSVVADQPVVCVPQNRIQTPTDAVPAKPSKRVAACAETKPEPTVPTTVLPVAPTTQPVATVKPISSMAKPVVAIVNGQTVQAQAQAPKQEPEHPPSFHHSLSRKEAAAILIMLAGLPIEIAAQIKAELVARLDQKSIHSSPVGYVRRLVEAARSETGFIPSATREITEREAREQAEKAKEREQAATERAKADANAAEATQLAIAMDAAGPERIAKLRLEFIQHLKKTNKMAYGLYQADGFNSVGFEMLFWGYLREKLRV